LVIYRVAAQPGIELATLKQALHALPNSAFFHYSYGMRLILKQHKAKAVSESSQAVKLASQNVQYAYIYFSALDCNSETIRAVRELKSAIAQYSNHQKLIQLCLGFAQNLKDRAAFKYFQQRQ
jgi:tetratricopeptide (TPR) repeat protein